MTSVANPTPLPQRPAHPLTLEQLAGLLECVNHTAVLLDELCRITYLNQAGERLLSRNRQQVLGTPAPDALPEIFGHAFHTYRQSHGLTTPGRFEEYHEPLDLWTESDLCPSPCGLLVSARDVSEHKRSQRISAGQTRVLEMVADGAPLADILHAITAMVEQQSPHDFSSILLLSKDARRLHLASGPSLPDEYNAAIEGAQIGPSVGSCGTAAFTAQLVIAHDIATDPRWQGYSDFALRHGLRACWSQPILSRDGQTVLGTVANYSRKPGHPTQQSLRLLETAAHLAQIAIEQSTADSQRRHTEKLLVTEAAVTRVLAAADTLAQAIPQILDAVCTTCDWETGAYWAVDSKAGLLRCKEFWRHCSVEVDEFEHASRNTAFPPGIGLPGRVWATARPAWISDVQGDPNFPRKEVAARTGLHGALGFPIMLNGQVTGVMEFFARSLRPPDQHLDSMLAVIGGQVGQFIHRMEAEHQLKAAKESAESANRAKDRFLAMLSHELRTPLSPALLVATAMASDQHLPLEVREDAATIQRNIQLQTRLIDDLLDVSRIENSKLSLQLETLDLHELLRDCILICDGDARCKGVCVTSDLRSRRHWVSADPFRLRQVVCNLLKNSIKFTPTGGKISIHCTDATDPTDARVKVIVSDSGIGADADILLKMFDPFEQGGRARESQGLGLGLTICKGLVHAHGGTIAASSDGPGRGMTMTVLLPALAENPAPAPRTPQDGSTPQPRPLKILLVDDHPDTLRALSRLLRRLEHRVVTADCVRSALHAAENNDFDLVISDLGLPDGSGTLLMQELLKRPRAPIKGIALTGYGTESDIRRTREAGFSAHLTKPINFDQLQSAILQTTPSTRAAS